MIDRDEKNITISGGGLSTGPISLNDMEAAAKALKSGRIPLKQDPEDKATIERLHNSTGAELRAFIERYERLEAERRDIADQMKEVMAEAKGRGFDTKVLRKVIALRKRDKDDIAEEQAVLDMYLAAIGES
jgi:uncharacterized protein (UPF0335 family)